LRGEGTGHINRIKGLLASYRVRMRVEADFLDRLETRRLWDGRPPSMGSKKHLVREYERLGMVKGQIKQVEAERAQMWRGFPSSFVFGGSELTVGGSMGWSFLMVHHGVQRNTTGRDIQLLRHGSPYSWQHEISVPYSTGRSQTHSAEDWIRQIRKRTVYDHGPYFGLLNRLHQFANQCQVKRAPRSESRSPLYPALHILRNLAHNPPRLEGGTATDNFWLVSRQ
jgi:hypothetical protein